MSGGGVLPVCDKFLDKSHPIVLLTLLNLVAFLRLYVDSGCIFNSAAVNLMFWEHLGVQCRLDYI